MKNTKENKNGFIKSIEIKHKWLWISLFIVFVIGGAAVGIINLYANMLNITEIGEKFLSIYLKDIRLGILCYLVAFIICMTVFSITSVILKKNLLKWEETAVFLKTKTAFFIMCGVLSFLVTYSLPYNIPRSMMVALDPSWFINVDPVFGKNIGYYVFQRPFFQDVTIWAVYLTITVLLYSLTIYFIYYVRNGAGGIKEVIKQPQIVSHISLIILAGYVLTALSSGFSAEYLLLNNTLTETSGGFTDIMVWSTFYKILPFIVSLVVIVSIIFIVKKDTKHTLFTLLSYPALWILVAIYALGVQTFYVTPNRATIEKPYIKYRIESTNQAYALDSVEEVSYSLEGKIDSDALSRNAEQINELIVNDEQNSLYMLNSSGSNKQVYYYKDADLVPYISGGKTEAKYTSAREILIPEENKTLNEYNNLKMRYTHGFGLGKIDASISSPPINPVDENSSQPRIYFGETEKDYKKDYIITGTTVGEYDPSDDGESYYSYDGPAGVKLTFFNRLIYAFRYGDPAILFSGNITENSKILFNRNVIERAKIAIPFLTYDENPYLVETSDGGLVWVLDGYTTTNSYPYAVKLYDVDEDFGTNYIRNSVKLTVDAYTGDINAYIIDWDDPIIRTLSSIYPDVFLTTSLPEEIASHLKYPEKLFEMQSNIYKTYHDTNPSSFYTGENAYEFAMSKSGESAAVKGLLPYYQMLNTDGKGIDFTLISAFTPAGKSENLTALFTVSSKNGNYGKLTLYTFPKNTNVFGTMQIENKIESDMAVQAELELLKSEGTIIYGPLTTLPIMDTICYIKPIYVNSDSIILKRVIVVCGESIAIDHTLPAAFKKLSLMNPKSDYLVNLPQTPEIEDYTPAEYNELVISALDKYSEAKQFLSESDWVNYAKTMEEFEDLLDEIRYDIAYPEEMNRPEIKED